MGQLLSHPIGYPMIHPMVCPAYPTWEISQGRFRSVDCSMGVVAYRITHGTRHGTSHETSHGFPWDIPWYITPRGVPHGIKVAHGIMVPHGDLYGVPHGIHASHGIHHVMYDVPWDTILPWSTPWCTMEYHGANHGVPLGTMGYIMVCSMSHPTKCTLTLTVGKKKVLSITKAIEAGDALLL